MWLLYVSKESYQEREGDSLIPKVIGNNSIMAVMLAVKVGDILKS